MPAIPPLRVMEIFIMTLRAELRSAYCTPTEAQAYCSAGTEPASICLATSSEIALNCANVAVDGNPAPVAVLYQTLPGVSHALPPTATAYVAKTLFGMPEL